MEPRQTTSERVDIHSHVLPLVDDGARSVDEALAMLRMAADDGTSTIVATPHAAHVTPESVSSGVEQLRNAAARASIDITICAGCEVKFSANLAEDFREGKLLTINDQGYLLVEFSFSRAWTSLMHTSLYALQLAGAMPVVAHAERYPAVQQDPSILIELAKMGIPIQVNAGSFLGEAGDDAQRTAELLLRAGLAHVLASDGHRLDKRKPVLHDAFARVAGLAGADQVQQLHINAQRVIAGRSLTTADPDTTALSPQSRLRGLFRRNRNS